MYPDLEPRQELYSSFLHRNRVYHKPYSVYEVLDRLSRYHPQDDFHHHDIPVDNHEIIRRHTAKLQKQRQFQNVRDNAHRTEQTKLISFLQNTDRSWTLRDVQHVVDTIQMTLSEFRSMTHKLLVDRFRFMDLTPKQEWMVLKAHKRAISSSVSPGHLEAQSTPNPYFV